jgi:hypothetical protein
MAIAIEMGRFGAAKANGGPSIRRISCSASGSLYQQGILPVDTKTMPEEVEFGGINQGTP